MIICTHRFGLTVLQEDWEASSLESSLGRGLEAVEAHMEAQQGRQRGVVIKRSPKQNPGRSDGDIRKFK